MSTLQKVKAYFGMVPLEPLDDEYAYEAPVKKNFEEHNYHEDEYEECRHRDKESLPVRYHDEHEELEERPSYRSHFSGGYSFSDKIKPRSSFKESYRSPYLTRGDLALDSLVYSGEQSPSISQIITLRPRDYSEARIVGERFRDGSPVIMDLVAMNNADAKRLVDFAAGLAFALRGTFDKVATKVFLLSPSDIEVSAEDRRKIVETGFYSRH